MNSMEATVPIITGCMQASSNCFAVITGTSVCSDIVVAVVTAKNRFIYLHKSVLFFKRG
jgi:hypothetical protein